MADDPFADADVCIIGSGAGGGTLAWALAEAGLKVVVLEKGPFYQRSDFTHDEVAITRRNFFVPFVADDPHVFAEDESAVGEKTTFGWISSCVGGGTVHWAGYAYRLRPEDLRERTLRGPVQGAELADWPIAYEALEPYYERIERELGVSGSTETTPTEPRRRSPLSLPPLSTHPLATHIDARARAAKLHPIVTPRAILTSARESRAACAYCHFCASYGCETGAKGSTLEAFIPRAIATGRCRVIADAMAKRVEHDAQGRATRVVYATGPAEKAQRARVIVLACSAIESARLLLLSDSAQFPHGLANTSGLVGRHLMMLTSSRVAADFYFDGRALVPGIASTSPFLCRSFRDHETDCGTLSLEFAPMSPIQVAEQLAANSDGSAVWGAALKERLRRHYRQGKHVDLEGFSECMPVAANRVTLDGAIRDRFGLPAARIMLRHHAQDLEASGRLLRRAEELAALLDADGVSAAESGGSYDVLQSGTCRFGKSPSTSVLDPNCRAHDLPNLYVVDSSFMPTMGRVPPTLTIMANALRVANAIVNQARGGG